jgi:GNAT superfamily N-acetyltransferase
MIREATLADVDQLVQLGLRFRASTGYAAILAENADQMRQTAERLIAQDDGVVFVSEDASGITGMIGMLLFAHHISGAWVAGEVFWYVEPSARGHGVRLVKQAEQWARAHGATQMHVTAPMGTDVGVLYQRLHFTAMEVGYVKDLAA